MSGKISNKANDKSLNVRSSASDPELTWIFQSFNARHLACAPNKISELEEGLLNAVDRNPITSVCALTAAIIATRFNLRRILHREGLHGFHLQRHQILHAEDYPRRGAFAQKMRLSGTSHVLFCLQNMICPLTFDEVTSTRKGMVNKHITHK
ncbi:hypothetical protein CEXT_229581 [Caerostris extrusa]|uniref:Uncharacterized protein n=1 Tax=Caerostris extrusa TaxID=172846 RepID=A0AAV4S2Q2_CAEEX|nr:hypothetical protein CEXT_229581 [Caerostris extrusa]